MIKEAVLQKNQDLKLIIPLTPSQRSLFSKMMASEVGDVFKSEFMRMGPIKIHENSIELNCFDVVDVLVELRKIGENSTLEFSRLKKQAEAAIAELLNDSSASEITKKNLKASLKMIQELS